jgi:hypothetical protein
LQGVVRIKSRAPGLLEARIREGLFRANKALVRLENLEESLLSWRENIRLEYKIGVVKIIDMHDR